ADRNLDSFDGEVRRHLPAALTGVFEAQQQHGEAVEDEAPHQPEGVGFTQHVDVAATENNSDQLQDDHHVDDAVAGAVFGVRAPEPIRQHTVLGDPVEHAVGANDGG